MKGKGIRGAMAASALSAVLCAGMLAGTTFAWFTDTAESTGNSILAGNLDITATKAELDPAAEAQYTFANKDDAEETYSLAFGAAEEFDGEAIISEEGFAPGMWNAKLLTVTNAGDLAVYVKLNFVTEDEGLADALWFDFIGVNEESVTGELVRREMSALEGFGSETEIPLEAEESVSYILIYGMRENAGNEYRGMKFNVDAYILARQQTEGAAYDTTIVPSEGGVITGQELSAALNDASLPMHQLGADAEVTEDINIYTDVKFDLNDKTITATETFYFGRNDSFANSPVEAELSNGTYVVSEGDGGRIRFENGCTGTFRNMTFSGGAGNAHKAIQIYANEEGSVNTYVFENCKFENTFVSFEGGSGGGYEYNVRFVNCTFEGTFGHGGAAVMVDDYIYGTFVFDGCNFKVTAEGNAVAAIKFDTYPEYLNGNTVSVTLRNVTIAGTSTESTYINYTPVPVKIRTVSEPELSTYFTLVEEGTNTYTVDGSPVNYDGTAKS